MKGQFTLLIICLCTCASSLFSQRRHFIKTNNYHQTLTLEWGGHRLLGNKAWGGSLGLSVENKISKHFALDITLKDYINASNFFILDKNNNPIERLREHRFVLQPALTYYPLSIFKGFYGSFGAGGLLHINSADDYDAVEYINGVPQLIPTLDYITSLKIGFQSIDFQGFVVNVFGNGGLFMPRKLKPMQGFFEVGMKVGIKK